MIKCKLSLYIIWIIDVRADKIISFHFLQESFLLFLSINYVWSFVGVLLRHELAQIGLCVVLVELVAIPTEQCFRRDLLAVFLGRSLSSFFPSFVSVRALLSQLAVSFLYASSTLSVKFTKNCLVIGGFIVKGRGIGVLRDNILVILGIRVKGMKGNGKSQTH
jgi:hypothetical protein